MAGSTYTIQRLFAVRFMLSFSTGVKHEEGQTFVEYAVLLGVLVVTMAAALTFVHDQIASLYTQISDDFNAALH
jgi:Flp pilus assembly pilin Flp